MVNVLIAGLGNPGEAYKKTRHNIGFRVVDALALKWQVDFAQNKKTQSLVAQYKQEDRTVFLHKPQTFMNNSGFPVRAMADYYGIALENILVVVDDAALDFGQMRLRKDSSCGGHNGLKSIEEHLGSNSYARLRIGIAKNTHGDLADYVLAKFSKEEEELLPQIMEKAVYHIERWLFFGLETAMNEANVKKRG